MSRDRIIQVYRGTTAQNDAFTGAAGEITMDTTRKELRVHDGSTAGGNLVGLKPGFVCPFAGTTAPDGWLICDGSAVSRTTYADLFAVIGTTYGAGDGNSTFNLPNCNYHNPYHDPNVALGHYHSGYVPNITGYIAAHVRTKFNGSTTGAFYIDSKGNNYSGNYYEGGQGNLGFNASYASDAYWNSRTVLAAGVNMNWIIKY